MASPKQLGFIKSLMRQLRRKGMSKEQSQIVNEIEEKLTAVDWNPDEYPGEAASEHIEELLVIKG